MTDKKEKLAYQLIIAIFISFITVDAIDDALMMMGNWPIVAVYTFYQIIIAFAIFIPIFRYNGTTI